MPPPSHVNMQGSHGSPTPRAHTLPAFSESPVSSLLGTLGARDEPLVCEPFPPAAATDSDDVL